MSWLTLGWYKYGLSFEVGPRTPFFRFNWGTFKRGLRLDIGWFTERRAEIGIRGGVTLWRAEAFVKVLKLNIRIWIGAT
jgi:hypothetical protein